LASGKSSQQMANGRSTDSQSTGLHPDRHFGNDRLSTPLSSLLVCSSVFSSNRLWHLHLTHEAMRGARSLDLCCRSISRSCDGLIYSKTRFSNLSAARTSISSNRHHGLARVLEGASRCDTSCSIDRCFVPTITRKASAPLGANEVDTRGRLMTGKGALRISGLALAATILIARRYPQSSFSLWRRTQNCPRSPSSRSFGVRSR
jgi:hypothetical protein